MNTISYAGIRCNVIIKDPLEHCQKHWVAGNFYEAHGNGLLTWAYANIPHGGIYIDIGANIGNHTLFMWKVMGASNVYSIEAESHHYAHLRENLLANDIPTHGLHCFALSDREGAGELVYDNTPTAQGGAMMGRLVEGRSGHITVMTLDSFRAERVTWMKLDIEGSEFKALKGGIKFIQENKPMFISCECMNENDFYSIEALLSGLNYLRCSQSLNHTPTFVWKHGE